MLELIERRPEFVPGYRDYCRELFEEGARYFRPTDPAFIDDGWFLRTKPYYDRAANGLIPGRSRSLHFWAVDGERFIGEFQLRTEFTENVLNDIGSIGYAVRPADRGRGCGAEILRLGLGIAREQGMERVLLTIDKENAASIRVCEKLGGRLSDELIKPGESGVTGRYWITL